MPGHGFFSKVLTIKVRIKSIYMVYTYMYIFYYIYRKSMSIPYNIIVRIATLCTLNKSAFVQFTTVQYICYW